MKRNKLKIIVIPLILCFLIFCGLILATFYFTKESTTQEEYFEVNTQVQFDYAKRALRNINEQIFIPLVESDYNPQTLQEIKHIIEGFKAQLESAYY